MTQTPTQDSKDWLEKTIKSHINWVFIADMTLPRDEVKSRALKAIMKDAESHYTKELEKADVRETKALEERDALEDKLDSLSEAVAAYFKVDIGEHSNVNDPVYNAYQLLRDNTRTAHLNKESN